MRSRSQASLSPAWPSWPLHESPSVWRLLPALPGTFFLKAGGRPQTPGVLAGGGKWKTHRLCGKTGRHSSSRGLPVELGQEACYSCQNDWRVAGGWCLEEGGVHRSTGAPLHLGFALKGRQNPEGVAMSAQPAVPSERKKPCMVRRHTRTPHHILFIEVYMCYRPFKFRKAKRRN